jgi:hypothetical protein
LYLVTGMPPYNSAYTSPMRHYSSSIFLLLLTLALFSGTAAIAQSFYPILNPSTYYVMPGTSFSVVGSRFAPGEKVIFTAFGNEPREIKADERGKFTAADLTVPFGVKSLTVSAFGQVSQATIKRTLSVGEYHPIVKASVYHLIPGGNVQFSGSGFAPDEPIEIIRNGTVIGVFETPRGAFNRSFSLPHESGDLTFEFRGEWSDATAGATLKIATLAKPWVKLSSYYLRSGSRLTISGKGFGAGEEVALSFEGGALGSVVTNARGEFTFNTLVPETTPGKKTIAAKGLLTRAVASEKLTKAGLAAR